MVADGATYATDRNLTLQEALLCHLCDETNTGTARNLTSMSKAAYQALCESHLRYALVVWGGATNTKIWRILVNTKLL